LPSKLAYRFPRRANQDYFPPFALEIGTLITLWTTPWSRLKSSPGFFSGRATVGEVLERRRSETADRIRTLKLELKDAEALCSKTACVYMTGSFSRGEANRHSDLDLFIVGKVAGGERSLGGLNEILIKSDLIRATRKLRIPDFSGEGEYLTHYTVEEIVSTLGKPEDDVNNTFTARLLLLLESKRRRKYTVDERHFLFFNL
jgi:predicted nucleotidyltransferase